MDTKTIIDLLRDAIEASELVMSHYTNENKFFELFEQKMKHDQLCKALRHEQHLLIELLLNEKNERAA